MAVRRALGFIQVGGGADGAADAASSPSRCALGRRSQAHAHTDNQNKPERKRGGRGAVPAEPLGDRLPLFPPRIAFFYRVSSLLFCTVTGRRAMSLSGALRLLRGLPARYIHPLSSNRSCRRARSFYLPDRMGRRYLHP